MCVVKACRGDVDVEEKRVAALKMQKTQLELRGTFLPWMTAPSLFSGGVLDVMAHAFVCTLPTPPHGARILDFCSGARR